jgi:HEPN domain-containing protein
MVCSAFALELYFKCLIRLGRKSFGNEHDLQILFSLIGLRQQSKIRRRWQQIYLEIVKNDLDKAYSNTRRRIPEATFDNALAMSKNAFTRMRYAYEGIDPDTGWIGDGILDCTRNRILEMHPGWERMRQIYPTDSIHFHFPHS